MTIWNTRGGDVFGKAVMWVTELSLVPCGGMKSNVHTQMNHDQTTFWLGIPWGNNIKEFHELDEYGHVAEDESMCLVADQRMKVDEFTNLRELHKKISHGGVWLHFWQGKLQGAGGSCSIRQSAIGWEFCHSTSNQILVWSLSSPLDSIWYSDRWQQWQGFLCMMRPHPMSTALTNGFKEEELY